MARLSDKVKLEMYLKKFFGGSSLNETVKKFSFLEELVYQKKLEMYCKLFNSQVKALEKQLGFKRLSSELEEVRYKVVEQAMSMHFVHAPGFLPFMPVVGNQQFDTHFLMEKIEGVSRVEVEDKLEENDTCEDFSKQLHYLFGVETVGLAIKEELIRDKESCKYLTEREIVSSFLVGRSLSVEQLCLMKHNLYPVPRYSGCFRHGTLSFNGKGNLVVASMPKESEDKRQLVTFSCSCRKNVADMI